MANESRVDITGLGDEYLENFVGKYSTEYCEGKRYLVFARNRGFVQDLNEPVINDKDIIRDMKRLQKRLLQGHKMTSSRGWIGIKTLIFWEAEAEKRHQAAIKRRLEKEERQRQREMQKKFRRPRYYH